MGKVLRMRGGESVALEDSEGRVIARIEARVRDGGVEMRINALIEIGIEHEHELDERPALGEIAPREEGSQ